MNSHKMSYCFDLDETLCYSSLDKPRDYTSAQPYKNAIKRVNKLFDAGHHITIFTARGCTSGVDWHETTSGQLKSWGVKYHKLIDKGKPHYDLFIDDRVKNALDWRAEVEPPFNRPCSIGFVASCFDLLHAGHCLFLKDARRVCDYLHVALQTDPTIDDFKDRPLQKPKARPIQSLEERRVQLEACKYVDEIHTYQTEKELKDILRILKPDIRILGSDYKDIHATGQEYSDQVYYHNRNHNWSSTDIKHRILQKA